MAVGARLWSLVAGPVTLVIITSTTDPVTQGYYFTFNSLLALQVFFELSFGQAVVQFASHEFARLRFGNDGTLEGDSSSLARLLSLARVSLKFYLIIGLLCPLLLSGVGIVFFREGIKHANEWLLPWCLLSFATGAHLILVAGWSLLEGCNQIFVVAKCRLIAAVSGSVALWVTLVSGGGLYAPFAASVLSFAVASHLLWKRIHPIVRQMRKTRAGPRLSWREEIWPFHWRMAISGISGTLSTNAVSPIIFRVNGPIAAGQFGMSMSIVNAISSVAQAWMQTKSARYGILISQKNFSELDRLAKKATAQAIVVCFFGILALVTVLNTLADHRHVAARFASPGVFLTLGAVSVLNTAVYGIAYYLRAHKREPLMILSLTSGAANVSLCLIGATLWGAYGVATGLLLVSLVALAAALKICASKRRAWQRLSYI
jgi:O-antigen/teichoic acid export membrane protein